MRALAACVLAGFIAFTARVPAAQAWGAQGHHIVSGVAAATLPDSVPPFLRTPEAIAQIRALGAEADRLRLTGTAYDADLDPAHFLDLDDDGTIAGAVPLANLPPTREAYDTALRTRGRPAGNQPATQYRYGYLPYAIIEGWQHIVQDFAIWRIDRYGEANAGTEAARAAYAADRVLREGLTVRDIGYWSHFVGDGSQPLHVSVHFNGWGNYPNPQGYSTSNTIHARFETAFLRGRATEALVAPRVGPYAPATQPFAARVADYLKATAAGVPAVYRFEGRAPFPNAGPEAVDFMLDRLAAGARAMRDWIADAYLASPDQRIGFPPMLVRDVERGAAPLPPLP
jgi:hypothetical protein